MKLNNGLLHAIQLAGGSNELAKKIGMRKQTFCFVLNRLDGYCPYYIRHLIMEQYNINEDEFTYYIEKEDDKYVTSKWIKNHLLFKYKTNKID